MDRDEVETLRGALKKYVPEKKYKLSRNCSLKANMSLPGVARQARFIFAISVTIWYIVIKRSVWSANKERRTI